jgi:hypothetical protein
MENINSLFVAIDPSTGRHLRNASVEEIRAYYEGNQGAHRAFYKTIRVGEVSVCEYNGPGIRAQNGFES